MHLFAAVAVIVAWGIGMVVRPAMTMFLTVLVVGLFVLAIYGSTFPPPHKRAVYYTPPSPGVTVVVRTNKGDSLAP